MYIRNMHSNAIRAFNFVYKCVHNTHENKNRGLNR